MFLIALPNLTISEREEPAFSNCTSGCLGRNIIGLNDGKCIVDGNWLCRTTSLEAIRYVFQANFLDLVKFVHCGVLVPQRLLWQDGSDREPIGRDSVPIY
jgi:hypothetical protein